MDAELSAPTNEAQASIITSKAPKRIGLALSGGGFRATLFHLGVVRFLFDVGLLSRVHFIGGVSGGSILAMHVGLHWDRYSGDHASFSGAAREVLDFCQRDVRNRIIRRSLLGQSRIRLLIAEYKHLFGDHTLSDLLPNKEIPKPRIMVQCVSLTTGQPCSFGRSGYMWYEPDKQGPLNEIERSVVAPQLPIAFAVAASSAFPPLFPPVHITAGLLHAKYSEFQNAQYVTDGGVYDNLGIERPLWHFEQHDELDAFIVSDAGGTFDWSMEHFGITLPRNVRATNILMKRVGDLMYRWLEHRQKKHGFAYIRITETINSSIDGTLPPEVQRCVSGIRTDLDAFTDLEISTLIQHGYGVARQQLIGRSWISANTPHCKWFPVQFNSMEANAWADSLCKSGKRKILPIFSLCDWPIWVAMAVFTSVLILALVMYPL